MNKKYIIEVNDLSLGKLEFETDDKHLQLHAVTTDHAGNHFVIGSRIHYSNGKVIPTGYTLGGVSVVEGSNDIYPYDQWAELKKAFKEGAIIEAKYPDEDDIGWEELENPGFNSNDLEYRIKGGIKVKHWDKHKEQIKAYWDGARLQMRGKDSGSWFGVPYPDWTAYVYRVKEEIKELTIEELEKELGYKIKVVGEK